MTAEHRGEDALRRELVAAVERLPGPDRGRLAAIERRLLARHGRRAPRAWWWALVGIGLIAGTATAYWVLGGEPDSGDRPGAPGSGQPEAPAPDGRSAGDGASGAETDKPGDSGEQDDDPIIYMGE